MATLTAQALAVNTDCVVTNSSATDVVVLNEFSEDTTPPLDIFEQTLTPLPFHEGGGLVKTGGTGTVTLDDTHVSDSGDTVPTTSYSLLITKADCLFPLKSTHSTQARNSTIKYYPGIGATAADYANMQLAEHFQQTIRAYPSSQLAKDFYTALDKADKAADSDDTDYIGDFFAATTGFQQVNLVMNIAIVTYYSQYPYVWADYQGSKTYYLYSSDGTTVRYAGSFQIKVPVAIPANPDKSLPGFSLTFTDASKVAKTLYYSKGQFVDDHQVDIPGICLAGAFAQKSDLTKVPTDVMIIPILIGTVYGAHVIGYDEKQTVTKAPNGSDAWSGSYDLLHPRNLMDWITLVLTGVGVFSGFKILMGGIEYFKNRFDKKKSEKEDGSDPSAEEVEEIKTKTGTYKDQMKKDYQHELSKLDNKLELPQDMNKSMDDYADDLTEQLNDDLKASCVDDLQGQSDFIESILDYGNTPHLQEAGDRISTNSTKLEGASTPESLNAVLPGVRTDIGSTGSNLSVELTRVNEMVSTEQKKLFDQAKENMDTHEKSSDGIDDAKQRAADGKLPDNLPYQPHEFRPGVFE